MTAITVKTIILRRIFPLKSTCPECGGTDYRPSGTSRSGNMVYRTCTTCLHGYRVCPIGYEKDEGGMQSVIVLW